MAESMKRVGRMEAGLYWIEDVFAGVQVGWIKRGDDDKKWYVTDMDYNMDYKNKAGPFETLEEADAEIENALDDEFGIGSPAN